jgi:uncharacterized membrane protein (DUF2068 family)
VLLVVLGLLLLAGDLLLIAFSVATGRGSFADRWPVAGQIGALARLPLLPPAVVAVVAALLAVVMVVVGGGFWRWRRWAWVCVMLLAAVLLTVNLVAAVLQTADHVTLALAIAAVFYLNQRDVQRRFGAQPAEAVGASGWATESGRSGPAAR